MPIIFTKCLPTTYCPSETNLQFPTEPLNISAILSLLMLFLHFKMPFLFFHKFTLNNASGSCKRPFSLWSLLNLEDCIHSLSKCLNSYLLIYSYLGNWLCSINYWTGLTVNILRAEFNYAFVSPKCYINRFSLNSCWMQACMKKEIESFD